LNESSRKTTDEQKRRRSCDRIHHHPYFLIFITKAAQQPEQFRIHTIIAHRIDSNKANIVVRWASLLIGTNLITESKNTKQE